MTIAPFLRSLAALLQKLLADGRAIHCTEGDAVELEILAGLFEGQRCERPVTVTAPMAPPAQDITTTMHLDVTPADFALGWLRASRVVPDYPDSGGPPFDAGLHEVRGDRIKRAAACAELSVVAMMWMERNRSLSLAAVTAWPHHGTIAGARAAWSFVVDNLPQLKQHFDAREKYRRELEAMK